MGRWKKRNTSEEQKPWAISIVEALRSDEGYLKVELTKRHSSQEKQKKLHCLLRIALWNNYFAQLLSLVQCLLLDFLHRANSTHTLKSSYITTGEQKRLSPFGTSWAAIRFESKCW